MSFHAVHIICSNYVFLGVDVKVLKKSPFPKNPFTVEYHLRDHLRDVEFIGNWM